MNIRVKELKDCEVWVDINIRGWNDNLKGIVSDRVLKIITDNRDSRIKRDIDNFIKDDFHYVLEDNDKVIGIIKIKQSTREGYENYGEVQALYLDTLEKGKGYGRALVNKGFEVLKNKGFNKVIIACLDGNPSNEFYKHIGGKFIFNDYFNLFDESYLENYYEYDI